MRFCCFALLLCFSLPFLLLLLLSKQENEIRQTKEKLETCSNSSERKQLMKELQDKLLQLELPGQIAAQQKVSDDKTHLYSSLSVGSSQFGLPPLTCLLYLTYLFFLS